MRPRLFCREAPYHRALLLTYSFDPVFFEQIVLHDLWAGRSTDIVVLGDRNQIDAAIQATAGPLRYLGRNYLLAGANHAGSFHPKLMLRLGPKGGAVMLGSGNITSSGWGGNLELGTAWQVGPDCADTGGWLHLFLDDALSWCGSKLQVEAVRRMRDVPWLSVTAPSIAGASPVLYSRADRSLAPALAQRWAGREFDELKVLTGSTDEAGAFLRWAHETFGIARATVGVTPRMASFSPEKLAALPFDVRLIPVGDVAPLHAKFYWFDGASGPGAVMGSANCSAAAWLLAPERGGNVETVLVYDSPAAANFASLLAKFDAPAYAPAEVLQHDQGEEVEPLPATLRYHLEALNWDRPSSCLQAHVRPPPPTAATVDLVVDGSVHPMRLLDATAGVWECFLEEGLGPDTTLAHLSVGEDAQTFWTQTRWVDDLDALRSASHTARLLQPFRGLEQPSSSTEQRQILEELQDVAHALFHDTGSFRDPGFGSGGRKKDHGKDPAAPVNPSDLVCQLEEGKGADIHFTTSAAASLSLTGILRLLFDTDTDGAASAGAAAADDEKLDEGQIVDGSEHNPERGELGKQNAIDAKAVERRFRERLAAQVTEFLSRMSSERFAETCTATQMVQAVSFPLVLALRGQRQGWVSEEHGEAWALEVFRILFQGKSRRKGGLLSTAMSRYARSDRTTVFEDVVGNGPLWMVLVAALSNARWIGPGTYMDKALAIREVYSTPVLVAAARREYIGALLGRIKIADARYYVAHVAPKITDLLSRIEDSLAPLWKEQLSRQQRKGAAYAEEDLLWRGGVGWAVCLEGRRAGERRTIKVRLKGAETQIQDGYYLNVSELAASDPHLAELLGALRGCVTSSAAMPNTEGMVSGAS